MRSYVTFSSKAFNTTEEREIFAQPRKFGDDVAGWFADRLSESGWEVDDEISQEPLGWFITFRRDADEFDLGVTCLNPERGIWLAWLEQPAGFFGALLGRRDRPIQSAGPNAVHEILASATEIDNIRWFTREEFVRGDIDVDGESAAVAEAVPANQNGYLS
ncbi:hypothetical protein [Fimbriimonas ginsengisoli]|uniref:Uncharacterized protein n=1 Tax=Fimbriimonas ginsengisoli Gsoil 348 TaxID=661478 RepID=A0A068NX03_FIMGI|nr:hypothetical protein [Fimbriimonas ginsengisoli]AIE86129.1 hypothetical protein OP10G_2761 [Fimbriimonas ginsengisoli Gsoil 348]